MPVSDRSGEGAEAEECCVIHGAAGDPLAPSEEGRVQRWAACINDEQADNGFIRVLQHRATFNLTSKATRPAPDALHKGWANLLTVGWDGGGTVGSKVF